MITQNQVMARLIWAVILGGLVGLEREMRRRTAGLRTHILVCVGSSLIMLTSIYVFDIYKDTAHVDPSRIAAGIVTGIGFLGAGAIIRSGSGVHGLTTAASLWVVAGIGMSVGCGFYDAALVSTALVLVVLLIIRNFENRFKQDKLE